MPFKLLDWIDDNREHLKPPVCNKQMFEDGDFIVQVVGGPNSRTDYHLDEGPELFYQVEGEMLLKTVQDGAVRRHPDRRRRDLPAAAARAALAAALPKIGRHRRRAHARAARARRLHVVLPAVARTSSTRNTCTWRTSSRTCRRSSSASTRSVARAHLQALRHRDAAEVAVARAKFDRGARGRARARRRRRARPVARASSSCRATQGRTLTYLCGHSLGLMPRARARRASRRSSTAGPRSASKATSRRRAAARPRAHAALDARRLARLSRALRAAARRARRRADATKSSR